MKSRPCNQEVQQRLADGSLILEYQNMVSQIAHRMAQVHDEDYDELVSEGYYGILRYGGQYDPTKSALSTWIYKSIWDQMKTFCLRTKKYSEIPTDFSDPTNQKVAKPCWFSDFIHELGEDAALLVSVTVEAPEELTSIIRATAPVRSRVAVQQYMRDMYGWDDGRISRAWNEVQECLNS